MKEILVTVLPYIQLV